MEEINYLLIVLAALAAIASPGPATLAIAGTSMNQGRYLGLAMAAGVLTGSLVWSTSAAFGLAAILHANVWFFEILRYCGALYLLYLALKSLHSAFNSRQLSLPENKAASARNNYFKGLLIHLTNPKAILFFGSLYSIGVPATVSPPALLSVILVVGAVSSLVFLGYAVLFSNGTARRVYLKSKVVFESVFSMFFGAASFKLLTSRIGE
ncbi:LysE family translocator [Marinobacter xestospongiae]|uniref:LysE family translocator n=1 Tax=Marinobacter xestospongiae TaxID=994319 RepID=A0ABU3VU55_9GAMM|nr:LysE family translocator [Marinobacter xestospongiae]MDV2077804.1 LysE family translocator [Marinobacter xestospongiae]